MMRKEVLAFLAVVCLLLIVLMTWGGARGVADASGNNTGKGNHTMEKATFAGGCFWCVEATFDKLDGVEKAVSGYTGGEGENPTYGDYAEKGHLEAVQITYDPAIISYEELLQVFWRQVDPTDATGQFVDRGEHYRSAIFYHDEQQKKAAEHSKQDLDASGRFDEPVVTEILPASTFYPAEDYHQNFCKVRPQHYKNYRSGSGRDRFLNRVWGKERHPDAVLSDDSEENQYSRPSDARIKEMLTKRQYNVTQEEGTEPAFKNKYWDNKREGIYVDVVSGEPLFASVHKFKSGTGWPSFNRVLEPDNIVTREDRSLLGTRTEVRSKHGDSHLGHVFEDGPEPTGLRYCLNSAALKFIPREAMEEEGYGEYLDVFEQDEGE